MMTRDKWGVILSFSPFDGRALTILDLQIAP